MEASVQIFDKNHSVNQWLSFLVNVTAQDCSSYNIVGFFRPVGLVILPGDNP